MIAAWAGFRRGALRRKPHRRALPLFHGPRCQLMWYINRSIQNVLDTVGAVWVAANSRIVPRGGHP